MLTYHKTTRSAKVWVPFLWNFAANAKDPLLIIKGADSLDSINRVQYRVHIQYMVNEKFPVWIGNNLPVGYTSYPTSVHAKGRPSL